MITPLRVLFYTQISYSANTSSLSGVQKNKNELPPPLSNLLLSPPNSRTTPIPSSLTFFSLPLTPRTASHRPPNPPHPLSPSMPAASSVQTGHPPPTGLPLAHLPPLTSRSAPPHRAPTPSLTRRRPRRQPAWPPPSPTAPAPDPARIHQVVPHLHRRDVSGSYGRGSARAHPLTPPFSRFDSGVDP
ncbi:hypothetical protein VPH35_118167 [Triticum aestivum]